MYIKVISNIYKAEILLGKIDVSNFCKMLKTKNVLFFITIEDSIALYMVCGFFRALIGKRTVGLSLEIPKEIPPLRSRIKYWIGKRILASNNIQTISIVPFEFQYGNTGLSKSWIYDLAYWDLRRNIPDDSIINDDVYSLLNESKKLFLYLGTLDRRKGFDDFVRLCAEMRNQNMNFKFIAAGDLGDYAEEMDEFKKLDGYVVGRVLTENEVLLLQKKSTLFWAYYPLYFNQSSGIVGRALQLNKHVIIRNGSLVHRMNSADDWRVISFHTFDAFIMAQEISKKLNQKNTKVKPVDINYEEYSIKKLNNLIDSK